MNFNDMWKRADLSMLKSYLKEGACRMDKPTEKSYRERIQDAESRAEALFSAEFVDEQDRNPYMEAFFDLAGVYEEVYFEIGLLTGAKIALQLAGKAAELSAPSQLVIHAKKP